MDKKSIIEEISTRAETVVQLLHLGEHDIKVVIRRDGYTPPCDGDYVKIKIDVCLPVGPDGVALHPDFQYGMRKNLMSEWMYQDWGVFKEGMRINSASYRAETWREAVTQAVEEVDRELNELVEVMNERREALKRAEG